MSLPALQPLKPPQDGDGTWRLRPSSVSPAVPRVWPCLLYLKASEVKHTEETIEKGKVGRKPPKLEGRCPL